MSKTTPPAAALILSLLAASWLCLGCRPVSYPDSYTNDHDQPALIEIQTEGPEGTSRPRILLVLGPGQRDQLWFHEDQGIHARSARDLQGRPLQLLSNGRVVGPEPGVEQEVWQGLGSLQVGLDEAGVRAILPSLSPLEESDQGEIIATAGGLELTFSEGCLGRWRLR